MAQMNMRITILNGKRRTPEEERELASWLKVQKERNAGLQQCKMDFSPWLERTDQPFKYNPAADSGTKIRGNPSTWAFCYLPKKTSGPPNLAQDRAWTMDTEPYYFDGKSDPYYRLTFKKLGSELNSAYCRFATYTDAPTGIYLVRWTIDPKTSLCTQVSFGLMTAGRFYPIANLQNGIFENLFFQEAVTNTMYSLEPATRNNVKVYKLTIDDCNRVSKSSIIPWKGFVLKDVLQMKPSYPVLSYTGAQDIMYGNTTTRLKLLTTKYTGAAELQLKTKMDDAKKKADSIESLFKANTKTAASLFPSLSDALNQYRLFTEQYNDFAGKRARLNDSVEKDIVVKNAVISKEMSRISAMSGFKLVVPLEYLSNDGNLYASIA